MNASEFRAEQITILHGLQAGVIAPNTVITGMRQKDGSYHVLSRYGDIVWTLPESLFSAGTTDYHKKLNFLRIPLTFRETLQDCMARYILSGIEGRNRARGGTIHQFFLKVTSFLTWLDDQGIADLFKVTPLISQQYVEFCKGLRGKKGKPISGNALISRLGAVETLHILSQQSRDPMMHPWPESSSWHLAGCTGKGNPYLQEARTEIIPDFVLGPLFQMTVKWLSKADEVIRISAKVERWKCEKQSYEFITKRLKKLGWRLSEIREAELHLQTACMCIILITSGIRLSELCSLEKQSAFVTLDEQDEPFYWMRGISYKTGTGACDWLVAEITHRALDVAERLVRPLQAQLEQHICDLHSKSLNQADIAKLSGHASRLFLTFSKRQNSQIGTLSKNLVLRRLNAFAAQCGLDWRFTPHQFRRTFAVYAAHSAFGDLRYLRDHFKHWSLDMTTLYAMSRQQDAELYDHVGTAALSIKIELLEHWLEPDAVLMGGAANPIRAFRTENEELNTKRDRVEMAKTISPLVHLRATGVAWCTADTGGCSGGQAIEKTQCADCVNAVIDESRKQVWLGIYAQQLEMRNITDIGPGGSERVERDIKRCKTILKGLGATEENLADVPN